MSALTKLFVVLLVVGVLTFVPGMITFINRVQDKNAEVAALKSSTDLAKAEREAMKSALDVALASKAATDASARAQQSELTKDIQNRDEKIGTAAEALAKSEKDKTLLTAQLAQSTDMAKLAVNSNTAQDTEIARLRGELQKAEGRAAEAEVALVAETKKTATLGTEVKYQREQIEKLKGDLASARTSTANNNTVPAGTAGARLPASTPDITGVVRRVEDVGGVLYATISVGRADRVEKGMEFKVVDPNDGSFLGILRVDTVDANEAFGRLEGDKITAVRPDMQVRTQL